MDCYIAQAGFELAILLPQPPKCWDYICVCPCLTDVAILKEITCGRRRPSIVVFSLQRHVTHNRTVLSTFQKCSQADKEGCLMDLLEQNGFIFHFSLRSLSRQIQLFDIVA